jgi:hypothetical protein
MNLDKLEHQVQIWNKAAIFVPIFFTTLLMIGYVFSVFHLDTLFFIACGLYFTTAVIWWWWAMTSIRLLVKILKRASNNIEEVTIELRSIKSEITLDR